MPIQVICPGCKKRFKVSEKFAGKKGPCPQCKTQITIPTATTEDVVLHAPETSGPKDSLGRDVLQPIKRQEVRVTSTFVVLIVAAALTVLIMAFLFRSAEGKVSPLILGAGALLLGPPLALAGYSFLRDDELEPYRGRPLWIRTLICGAVFAAMWGVYWGVKSYLFGGDAMEVFQLAFIVPPLLLVGAGAAAGCYDLDFANGAISFAMYLAVTVLLRLIMNLPPF